MLRVLQNRFDIEQARSELLRRRASALDGPWVGLLRRLGLLRGVAVGDALKSWDVLLTANFVESRYGTQARVLDLGCFGSEILPVLHRLGLRDLTGIDLNPLVHRMPLEGAIRYLVGDFLQASLADRSFDCITAISVIEHGFQPQRLLAEVSRMLSPGGAFVASFDYWPQKIDTRGQRLFGLSWDIFSADEVASFVEEARSFGLSPQAALDYGAAAAPIDYAGRRYTFAWLALCKG
jgi:SAM-dependent methyltransferase